MAELRAEPAGVASLPVISMHLKELDMTAYVVAMVEVENPEEYKEYLVGNTAVVEQYGGRFAARGGKIDLKEGDWIPKRAVLIEFPSMEAAQAWYNSPEYQQVAPIRRKHARTRLLAILEGTGER
jgi:uncharacterized protein (DUF1330 family)